MGLLNDLQMSPEETKRQNEGFATFLRGFLAENAVSPEFKAACEGVLAGDTVGTVLGLETPHRDAIVAQGYKYLQLQRLDEAKDWLSLALAAEPLDERALYGLGVIAQMQGDLKRAVRALLQFQALDATNPDGLLRLGECLYANRELEEAGNCFTGVLRLVEAGYGAPRHRAYAERMLAVLAGETAQVAVAATA